MANLPFKIEGTELLLRKLDKLSGSVDRNAIEPKVLKEAKVIADNARNKAPRGPTGNLKRSLHARMLKHKTGYAMAAIAAVDRKIAPHAHFIEFGTSKMSARPFFRPAVDECSGKAKGNLAQAIKSLIEGAV